MAAQIKWYWIIGVFVLIFVVGMFTQKSYGIFAILPTGQFNSNQDCTFITNTDYGANGESIDDYGGSGNWVAVDWDNNGAKEGYGYYGSTTGTGDLCSSKTLITTTPIGLKVVKYAESTSYKEIGICGSDGKNVKRYRDNDADAQEAILQCVISCTENWQCGSWSTCSSGTQTRTCNDLNNCGTTFDKPITTQSCTITETCLLTDANSNGIIDRDELGQAIQSWISS